MGYARPRPKRLAEKLRQVRLALGLSQDEMLKRLGVEDQIDNARISGFETGLREPSLMILLQYAHIANLYIEALVDDDRDLPAKLPSPTKSEGIKRAAAPRTRKR
jgi:transcriptional regulator with XRE-family HTH domain